VVSTEIDELNTANGIERLLEFDTAAGDVNTAYEDMGPGPVFCLDTEAFGQDAFFYVQVTDEGTGLRIERLAGDCTATAIEDRAFTGAAMDFVR